MQYMLLIKIALVQVSPTVRNKAETCIFGLRVYVRVSSKLIP
jgi:hypothetical protein